MPVKGKTLTTLMIVVGVIVLSFAPVLIWHEIIRLISETAAVLGLN